MAVRLWQVLAVSEEARVKRQRLAELEGEMREMTRRG